MNFLKIVIDCILKTMPEELVHILCSEQKQSKKVRAEKKYINKYNKSTFKMLSIRIK